MAIRLRKGMKVRYTQATSVSGPWRIEHDYGDGTYRIVAKNELCDLVPRHMLTPLAKKGTPDPHISDKALGLVVGYFHAVVNDSRRGAGNSDKEPELLERLLETERLLLQYISELEQKAEDVRNMEEEVDHVRSKLKRLRDDQ